jgi:2-polyprenyl-3-methyl-5-hydroxy-6-metoxy-1,4-benzoquinol methylase
MNPSQSFVDFYNKNKILPVNQEIENLGIFLSKREFLHNSLGVPMSTLSGKRICEFGPGTGQNSLLYMGTSCQHLTLVDGSIEAISLLTERFMQDNCPINISICHKLFHDFCDEQQYDLVWAEGCIPQQSDPVGILLAISSHVKPGGILCISTISGLSHLSETLRRLYSSIAMNKEHPQMEDLNTVCTLFKEHLSTLSSKTRPIRDWCLDVVIQRLDCTELLSVPEAIHSLGENFSFYSSLPNILSPFYWYKEFDAKCFNGQVSELYYCSNMCFVSKHLAPFFHDRGDGVIAEELGNRIWGLVSKFQQGYAEILPVLESLTELSTVYRKYNPDFSANLIGLCNWFREGCKDKDSESYKFFTNWWGRGQQYVSFIRK